ncbi:MAG: GGDEF domain-containing protein [Telmatospirillum sp.]|nr:GGDEF domain-containing protein [Telmatospirillum sp.]
MFSISNVGMIGMSPAIKITVAYLCAGSAWISGADWFFAQMAPAELVDAGICKMVVFLLASSALLYALIAREAARRDAVERDLRAMAVHDPLTGLLNRACFVEHLEKAVAGAARDQGKVGVAFIDLDGFKGINDRHGHQAGDQLLREVGRRISGMIRASDCGGRLGGDEFVVMMRGDSAQGMRRFAERLTDVLRQPFLVMGTEVTVTASVGLASYPDNGIAADQLLRAADLAMYRAKASGKDGIRKARPSGRMQPVAA